MIKENERNYLMEKFEELMETYDYESTSYGIGAVLDEWAARKEKFIDAFRSHPNYVDGQFMIVFPIGYVREIDRNASYRFYSWLVDNCFHRSELHPQEIRDRTSQGNWLPQPIFDFFFHLERYASRCISKETAAYLNNAVPEIHAHEGQKTSRVVNKLCTYLGYDKVDGYNREFARYADSLSPATITLHTVISVNPLDYLTMSFGNSWSSCHTIDKQNRRGMANGYGGMRSSGTISYMLDETSVIVYTVDSSYNGNEYWNQPKINRQMFHFGEDKLVQARLYPQSNDGATETYTPYRNLVQQVIAEVFDFPNLWTLKKDNDVVCRYIASHGTNYPDYRYYNGINISFIKGTENSNRMIVGAMPICVECGERHDLENSINCCTAGYRCSDCGCRIDEDDVIEIDGEIYCRDCVTWCEWCEEYHRGDSYYIRDRQMYVCEYCATESGDFFYCDCCGEYYSVDQSTWVEEEYAYYCDDCFEENFAHCENCGQVINIGDAHVVDGLFYCEDCYEANNADEEEIS